MDLHNRVGLVGVMATSVMALSTAIAQSPVITGTITTYAGPQLPIDGVAADAQAIDQPTALFVDRTDVYISSSAQNRVYKVTAGGILI